MRQAAEEPLYAASAYAETKRSHLDTARQCRANGVEFIPMVAETTGAWEPSALRVLRQLARMSAQVTGKPVERECAELLQRLSVRLRRAHSRALLRRLGGDTDEWADADASAQGVLAAAAASAANASSA